MKMLRAQSSSHQVQQGSKVVLRRAFFLGTALALAEAYDITPNDVGLHVLPVHHLASLGASFFTFLDRKSVV